MCPLAGIMFSVSSYLRCCYRKITGPKEFNARSRGLLFISVSLCLKNVFIMTQNTELRFGLEKMLRNDDLQPLFSFLF